MLESVDVFYGGGFHATRSGVRVDLVDPSTEEAFASVDVATADDVDPAVDAAQTAFDDWAGLTFAQRANVIDRIVRAWRGRADDIAASVSREMGMPFANSLLSNGTGSARNFEYFADMARAFDAEQRRTALSFLGESLVRWSPVGVVAAIAPWNYPCYLMTSKLAPAMAAGCTVVLKPPIENGVTARLMAEVMIEAEVPAGVVNIVVGDVGFAEGLVAHPDVAKIAFTGSTAVGKHIGAVAGGRLASTNLELGGKSAALVLNDADLEHTLRELPPLSFRNSGQTCFAQTRVVATPAVYDAVVQGFAQWTAAQTLGPAFAETTTLGPLASARQRATAHRFIDSGLSSGFRLVAGGRDAEIPGTGYFVAPTVFADVDNDSELAQEEVFGPVVCIIPAVDENDAIRIANDSRYGLAATVWTADINRGTRVARRLQAGTVGINGYRPDLGAPFGGVKESGSGRENGLEGLHEFLRPDSVYVFDTAGGIR